MTTRNEKVNIKIGAQDAGALRIINGIQKQLIGLAGAYMGFNALKSLFSSIVELGSESQLVWNDVSASLVRHGYEVENNIKKIKSFSAEMQTMTGESDELIGKSIKMFIDFGNSIEKSFDIMKTAADLAAGADMNLESAVDLLNKASVGYTATLSRYGIIIDENIPKTQKFAAAIKQIEDRFGGAAASRADSFAVKIKLLNERFGDLQEEIFNLFSPALFTAVNTGIDLLNTFIGLFGDVTQNDVNNLSGKYNNLTVDLTYLNEAYRDGKISIEEYNLAVKRAMSGENIDAGDVGKGLGTVVSEVVKSFWWDLIVPLDKLMYNTSREINQFGMETVESALQFLKDFDAGAFADSMADAITEAFKDPNRFKQNKLVLPPLTIPAPDFTDYDNALLEHTSQIAYNKELVNLEKFHHERMRNMTALNQALYDAEFIGKDEHEKLLLELELEYQKRKDEIKFNDVATEAEKNDALLALDRVYVDKRLSETERLNKEIEEENQRTLDEQLEAQRQFNESIGYIVDDYADQWLDVMFGIREASSDIWKSMAIDFSKLFIKKLMADWLSTLDFFKNSDTSGIGGGGGGNLSIGNIVGTVIGGIIGSVLKQNVGMINGDNLLGGTSRRAVTIVNNYYQGVVTQDFISKDVIPSVSIASKRKETSIIGIEAGKLGGSLVFSN